MYFCINLNVHILLAKYQNDKYYLKQNSTSRINLIDRIKQNKFTNNVFGYINITMATI